MPPCHGGRTPGDRLLELLLATCHFTFGRPQSGGSDRSDTYQGSTKTLSHPRPHLTRNDAVDLVSSAAPPENPYAAHARSASTTSYSSLRAMTATMSPILIATTLSQAPALFAIDRSTGTKAGRQRAAQHSMRYRTVMRRVGQYSSTTSKPVSVSSLLSVSAEKKLR